MTDFIIVEGCNFVDFPMGGQLTFARQLMHAYGQRVALVGISTDNTPVGVWVKKKIDGIEFDFFAYEHRTLSNAKPIIPARLSGYVNLLRFRRKILSYQCNRFFIQSHELAVGILKWPKANVCFCFPGIENPLLISRYPWASIFANYFDYWFLSKVASADVILAAADVNAIATLKQRGSGLLSNRSISVFPTRVDTSIFNSGSKSASRRSLGLLDSSTIIVTTGRIHWAKGWSLLLEAFSHFLNGEPHAKLYFVGDGEDRPKLLSAAETLGISDSIVVTGFLSSVDVANYLRSSDVFALASFKEGWSTSLVEALATGVPIMTTAVSSADCIVTSQLNGIILYNRDPKEYAKGLNACRALERESVREFSTRESMKYSVDTLYVNLSELWPL